jgi:hypothetical protein
MFGLGVPTSPGVRSLILAFVFPTWHGLGLRQATCQPMVLAPLRLKYPYAQVLEGSPLCQHL